MHNGSRRHDLQSVERRHGRAADDHRGGHRLDVQQRTGDYNSELAKKMDQVRAAADPDQQASAPTSSVTSEYTQYYYAQVIYCMGEDGYLKLFPDSKPDQRLTWSGYRKEFFEFLATKQNAGRQLDRHADRAGVYDVPVSDGASTR